MLPPLPRRHRLLILPQPYPTRAGVYTEGKLRRAIGEDRLLLYCQPKVDIPSRTVSVPSLLWDQAQAKSIESPNAALLIRLHGTLDDAGKADLQQFLLSHLHKLSPYADIAYFIFLVLHRMGRTIDAIHAARARLAGDKVFGYSNLLGTLSAIVSHEHFNIHPDLYPRILDALAGDTEHNFRLTEKINLARLQRLDSELKAQANTDTETTRLGAEAGNVSVNKPLS